MWHKYGTYETLEPQGIEYGQKIEKKQIRHKSGTNSEQIRNKYGTNPCTLNKYKNKHKYFLPPYIPPKGEEKNTNVDFTPYPDTEHGNVLSTKTDISTSISNTEKEKVKYRDNVLLTKKEYETLLSKHGENKLNKILDLLHFYKLSQDKTYKSDYGAINTWVVTSIEEKEQKAQAKGQKAPSREERNFKPEELESLME